MESLNTQWHLYVSARCVLISIFTLFVLMARTDAGISMYRSLVEVDHDGNPSWLSAGDRTLVSQIKNGIVQLQPNAIVAMDGSGQYKTVTDGINSYPNNHQGRYIIYVKAGIYKEYVTVDQSKTNILLYGDGPNRTIITGNKNVMEGIQMPLTATFSTFAENFIAISIAFENTAGPKGGPAVALRVKGDLSSFYQCTFRGYQDTLYVDQGRQFYRNCLVSGTIDFICGHSTTLIQNSMILVRMPASNQYNVVVADGPYKNNNLRTGIVLQNCNILPDSDLAPYTSTVKTYLARPWKPYSTAIFLNNFIGNFIQSDGYTIWREVQPNNENAYFAEFGNTGPGANANNRVYWAKGVITKDEAARFTAESWIQAKTWLPSTGIPYNSGFETLS